MRSANKFIVPALALAFYFAAFAHATPGGGAILFRPQGAAVVPFRHDAHKASSGPGCRECHYSLFPAARMQRLSTMKEMKQGRSCGFCHNGSRAFGLDGNCALCHKDGA